MNWINHYEAEVYLKTIICRKRKGVIRLKLERGWVLVGWPPTEVNCIPD